MAPSFISSAMAKASRISAPCCGSRPQNKAAAGQSFSHVPAPLPAKSVAKDGLSSGSRKLNSCSTYQEDSNPRAGVAPIRKATIATTATMANTAIHSTEHKFLLGSTLNKQSGADVTLKSSSLLELSRESSAWLKDQATEKMEVMRGPRLTTLLLPGLRKVMSMTRRMSLGDCLHEIKEHMEGGAKVETIAAVPGALKMLSGDWGNYRCTTKHMIIVLLAYVGTLSLTPIATLPVLDAAYTQGVLLALFGALYLTLPVDIIPDRTKGSWTGLPWGYIFGALPILTSFYCFHGLHQKALSFHGFPLFLSLVVIVMTLALLNRSLRWRLENLKWLFVGLWAILGYSLLDCGRFLFGQVTSNTTLVFGIGLYFSGFICNALPSYSIPDCIPFIGKHHDVVLGYVLVVSGMMVFAMGVLAAVLV